MASTQESPSPEQSSSVQPSATLIEALHHKLCDPSIVPKFEQCRSTNVTQRLLSHRWILKSSVDKISSGVDDTHDDNHQADIDICGSSKDDSTQMRDTNQNGQQNNHNNKPKYNTVPQRTYLTLRIEQNQQFANDQYLRCQKKLSALSSTSPKSVEAINVNRLTIQKVIDAIRNQLKEGLAACPDHGGLIQVEREVRVWMDRLNGVDNGGGGGGGEFKECSKNVVLDTAAASAAMRVEERRRGNTETISSSDLTTEQQPNTQQHIAVKRKGGDGRAQAAMDDAMIEKMFLQDESTNHGDDGAAVGTNNLKWAPPASSRVDQNAAQKIRKDDHMSDSDSYHDRKRSKHHKRSRHHRSISVERRSEDRRKGERKRHHRHHHRRSRDNDRKRKKRRHRSRSRSMSRGSASPPEEEEASLSSHSNTSRDRSRRRHRSDRHGRYSKRRHKSKSHRKERRKSSKRHHRSRRERSQSVSSSSSAVSAEVVDGIKDRFVPPSVKHGRKEEVDDGIKERFIPPQLLSQSVHHGRKEEGASGIERRFVPPQLSHSAQHSREEERAVRKEDIEGGSMPASNDNEVSADTNR